MLITVHSLELLYDLETARTFVTLRPTEPSESLLLRQAIHVQRAQGAAGLIDKERLSNHADDRDKQNIYGHTEEVYVPR